MPNNTRINWYQNDVMVAADNASLQGLLAIAFQIEARAKVDAPVDTGFMRNSSYVVGADVNTFQAHTDGDYQTAPSPEPAPPNGVTFGFAASYTIYQEERQPFVYPAVVAVANEAGGIIAAAGRQYFD